MTLVGIISFFPQVGKPTLQRTLKLRIRREAPTLRTALLFGCLCPQICASHGGVSIWTVTSQTFTSRCEYADMFVSRYAAF